MQKADITEQQRAEMDTELQCSAVVIIFHDHMLSHSLTIRQWCIAHSAPRGCRDTMTSLAAAVSMDVPHMAHYVQTSYTIPKVRNYCIAVREGPSHGHR